jgi:hypothetical protein
MQGGKTGDGSFVDGDSEKGIDKFLSRFEPPGEGIVLGIFDGQLTVFNDVDGTRVGVHHPPGGGENPFKQDIQVLNPVEVFVKFQNFHQSGITVHTSLIIIDFIPFQKRGIEDLFLPR